MNSVLNTWYVCGLAPNMYVQVWVGFTDENLMLREVRSPAQACTASEVELSSHTGRIGSAWSPWRAGRSERSSGSLPGERRSSLVPRPGLLHSAPVCLCSSRVSVFPSLQNNGALSPGLLRAGLAGSLAKGFGGGAPASAGRNQPRQASRARRPGRQRAWLVRGASLAVDS